MFVIIVEIVNFISLNKSLNGKNDTFPDKNELRTRYFYTNVKLSLDLRDAKEQV